MSVITTYSFTNFEDLAAQDGSGGATLIDMDMTSMTGGGLAISGLHNGSGHVDINIFDSNAGNIYADSTALGSHSAIDQLLNGNLVMVTDNGTSTHYLIVDAFGNQVVGMTNLGIAASSNADVAALGGGRFVVAHQVNYGVGDNDIEWLLREADGSVVTGASIDVTSANDRNVQVCALADGGYAIAWERLSGTSTSTWYAVFNANGSTRFAGTQLDSFGTVNRNVTMAATADGGFAIAYEDTGWTGEQIDVTVATFSAAGSFEAWINATEGADYNASGASLTSLQNGMLALSYSVERAAGDNDVYMQLLREGSSGASLEGGYFFVATTAEDEIDSTLAEYGTGEIAIAWTGDGQTAGRTQSLLRTSAGDGANDVVNGDDFLDNMYGAGGNDLLKGFGNNDTLDGAGGNDTLNGGKGGDLIRGGTGRDILTGQGGRDVFDFNAVDDSTSAFTDRITDLSNKDRIDLKDIDADINVAGDQKFHLVSVFSGDAREALLTYHAAGAYAGKTTLELDDDGDSVADFILLIDGDWDGFTKFAL